MSPGAGGEPDGGRRAVLKLGIGALGLGLAAVPAVPAIGYLLFPSGVKHGEAAFLPAGKRSALAGSTPVRVDLYADKVDAWNKTPDVKLGSCWVLERDGALHAFSTVCPHLGCAVDFDAEAQKFKCPCHRSAFGLDGTVEAGPSPRPLDSLEIKEQDGLVAIRLVRYRQGVADKEPV
ncbi:QcrA and Rieske domain-containing protein [Nannocystis radixulma]|uniref:Rieske 2Fe-2S domain-containing protein n=1 Tax=Nannocystis radixulma TaxID=2995305 RepID=A0ABT5BAI1_9BACT|nr:Rieske 2Fe-2S domain-containing protein [Nannocystis radixulma]MDC0671139.1 Rieske 2Fe-2S domain-containing protein [Nannocystis radixulma]